MILKEFHEFIRNRRSIRKLRNTPVSRDQLTRILQAGSWAPSAHNAQPWRFFVVQNVGEKQKLAKAMGRVFRKDLEADDEEPALIDDLVNTSVERFSSVPLLIVVCLTMEPMDMYPDEQRQHAEYVMGVQSVAAALTLILLAAHAEGLAGCWYCAPLFCPDTVRKTLRLSDEMMPQALLTLGLADEIPEPPMRYPFEKFVSFIGEKED